MEEAVKVAVENGAEAVANIAAKNPDTAKDVLIVLGTVAAGALIIGGTIYIVKKHKKTAKAEPVKGPVKDAEIVSESNESTANDEPKESPKKVKTN